ncbi:unnamed protein product [Protopolystoma xenopodis]|uniref:ABC-2 type transporter transmembrane domain-containing protein n=1 Tax=Protopolystoma xenopodis TaxID=117903 RepID=A0A448XDX1_9PLAT|nr:unnamed protein product [Protopolystoma xenopodis]
MSCILGIQVKENRGSNTIPQLNVTLYFMGESYHAVAVGINAFSNALIRYQQALNTCLLEPFTGPRILAANQPLPETDIERAQSMSSIQGLQNVIGAAFPLSANLLIAVSFLSASISLWLVHERACKAKHLQFVSGVHLSMYWLSTYIWDICMFVIISGLILAIIVQYNVEVFMFGTERLLMIFITFLLFGWASIPQMYLLSYLFSTPASGLVGMGAFSIISAFLASLTVMLLSLPQISLQLVAIRLSRAFSAIFPSYAFVSALFLIVQNYEFRKICDNPLIDVICENPEVTMPCCLGELTRLLLVPY